MIRFAAQVQGDVMSSELAAGADASALADVADGELRKRRCVGESCLSLTAKTHKHPVRLRDSLLDQLLASFLWHQAKSVLGLLDNLGQQRDEQIILSG